MFDSKRLLKIIEREERSGIVLIFDEIMFSVLADRWLAETTRGRLLDEYREVLGHIVEVLGYIPESEVVKVTKIKGEYVIEHPMPEVITVDVCRYKLYERDEPVQYTGLSYGGPLWQTADGTIRRCSAAGPDPGGRPVLTDREIMASFDRDNGEAAYYSTFRPREDISDERTLELWAHLESVQWNEWARPAAEQGGEIEGQEEIGDV